MMTMNIDNIHLSEPGTKYPPHKNVFPKILPETQPDMRPLSDKDHLYILMDDYCYKWGYSGNACQIRVPARTVTDGASVPRFVWWFLRPDGLIRAAALVHDYVYRQQGNMGHSYTINGVVPIGRLSRKQADKLFYQMLLAAGVNKFKAKAAYKAVRMFGGKYWRN